VRPETVCQLGVEGGVIPDVDQRACHRAGLLLRVSGRPWDPLPPRPRDGSDGSAGTRRQLGFDGGRVSFGPCRCRRPGRIVIRHGRGARRRTVPRDQSRKPGSGRSRLKPTSRARRSGRTLRSSRCAAADRFPARPGFIPLAWPLPGRSRDRGRDREPPGLLRAEDGERRC
jgi:hypothetical protein